MPCRFIGRRRVPRRYIGRRRRVPRRYKGRRRRVVPRRHVMRWGRRRPFVAATAMTICRAPNDAQDDEHEAGHSAADTTRPHVVGRAALILIHRVWVLLISWCPCPSSSSQGHSLITGSRVSWRTAHHLSRPRRKSLLFHLSHVKSAGRISLVQRHVHRRGHAGWHVKVLDLDLAVAVRLGGGGRDLN